jgi:hypothetical protein
MPYLTGKIRAILVIAHYPAGSHVWPGPAEEEHEVAFGHRHPKLEQLLGVAVGRFTLDERVPRPYSLPNLGVIRGCYQVAGRRPTDRHELFLEC